MIKQPKVKFDHQMNVIDIDKPKSTYKAKFWDDSKVRAYWLLRDRVIYKTANQSTKNEILERYKK